MIDYFNTQLNNIYVAKRTYAKETSQAKNKALIDLHPEFDNLLKNKKQLELDIVKAKAKGIDITSLQKELADTDENIKRYAKQNGLNFTPPYICPHCKDTGYVGDKPCDCMQAYYSELLKKNASLTALPEFCFGDNKFGQMDIPQAVGMNKLYSIMQNKVCGNFDNCKWNNFMLLGASGVGKTCLALATADALLKKNVSVFYLSAFELVNIFLDRHTHKQSELSKKASYVECCEMLIIDNFGEEPIYRNVTLEYLFSALDRRMAENKKTFICSRLDANALLSRYGETFLSKFADKKYSLSVGYVTGENLRKS